MIFSSRRYAHCHEFECYFLFNLRVSIIANAQWLAIVLIGKRFSMASIRPFSCLLNQFNSRYDIISQATVFAAIPTYNIKQCSFEIKYHCSASLPILVTILRLLIWNHGRIDIPMIHRPVSNTTAAITTIRRETYTAQTNVLVLMKADAQNSIELRLKKTNRSNLNPFQTAASC